MEKKKIVTGIILLITFITSIYFIPWGLLAMLLMPTSSTIQEQMDRSLDHGLDGILVYVDQAGVQATYAAGWKDRDQQIEARPEDLFKIASISKLYIAAAAAKMVDQGLLDLGATLTQLLPEYAHRIEYAETITLAQMIGHRSGIPNYSDDVNYPWDATPMTYEGNLEYALDKEADFEPDKKYAYSNTNYLLLGMIMDQTLGYSHHLYIDKEILEPLGLERTYHELGQVNKEQLMGGYFVGYPLDIKNNDFISPGGSMISTAEEVGIFLKALNKGTLLTPEQQAIYSRIYVYEHTGLLPGYMSIAKYNEKEDTTLIVFVNTSGGDRWSRIEILYNKLEKILGY